MNKIDKLAVVVLSVTLLLGCSDDDDDNTTMSEMATYEIKVSNLTNNQPMTPLAAVVHKTGYAPWQVGEAASNGLEKLGESGDTTDFIAEAEANSAVVASIVSTAGPFGPGSEESVVITVIPQSDLMLSLASMLANTNDAITGVEQVSIGAMAKGASLTLLTHAYDIGTEQNTEAAGTIPGPADGGEGYNVSRSGDINRVTIHPGVVSVDDGLSTSVLGESHRWNGPVAKVQITRTQ